MQAATGVALMLAHSTFETAKIVDNIPICCCGLREMSVQVGQVCYIFCDVDAYGRQSRRRCREDFWLMILEEAARYDDAVEEMAVERWPHCFVCVVGWKG